MFDIGTQELILIFIVALLVFGPNRLPELARTLGRGVRELKSALQGVQRSIEESDITEEIKKARATIQEEIIKKDLAGIDTEGKIEDTGVHEKHPEPPHTTTEEEKKVNG